VNNDNTQSNEDREKLHHCLKIALLSFQFDTVKFEVNEDLLNTPRGYQENMLLEEAIQKLIK
jgi:hypothetical protein